MRIRQNLPQFEDKEAVMLVTGVRAAEIYRANHGVILKIDEFEIPKSEYSDSEGFFLYGSRLQGHEEEKVVNRRKFAKEIERRVLRALPPVRARREFYLYAPDEMISLIEAHLPPSAQKIYKASFRGNFLREHPFTLLMMIAQQELRGNTARRPLKEEVMRILRIARLNLR